MKQPKEIIEKLSTAIKPYLGKAKDRLSSVAPFLKNNRYLGGFLQFIKKSGNPAAEGKTKGLFAYITIFFLFLFLFVFINFDKSLIKVQLEEQIAAATGGDVYIKKLGFSFPPGIKLVDFRLNNPAQGYDVKLKSLIARPLFLPIFAGSVKMRFVTKSSGGFFRADVSGRLEKNNSLKIFMKSSSFPIHSALLKVNGMLFPLEAIVDAKGKLEIPDGQAWKASGGIEVKVFKIKIKPGSLADGLFTTSAPTNFKCKVEVDKGKLITKDCKTDTEMGTFELAVETTLSPVIDNSPLRGIIIIKNPSSVLESLLSLYGGGKQPDGSYQLKLSGTFAQPSIAM